MLLAVRREVSQVRAEDRTPVPNDLHRLALLEADCRIRVGLRCCGHRGHLGFGTDGRQVFDEPTVVQVLLCLDGSGDIVAVAKPAIGPVAIGSMGTVATALAHLHAVYVIGTLVAAHRRTLVLLRCAD